MPEPTILPNSNSNTSGGTDSNPGSIPSITPPAPAATPLPPATDGNFINDNGLEVSDALAEGKPLIPAPDTVTPGVSFDTFKDLIDGNAPIALNEKPAVVAKEEPKKEEPRKEEAVAKTEEVKKTDEPATEVTTEPTTPLSAREEKFNARDLADLPTSLQPFFRRKMSDEAFKAIKPYIINLKKEIERSKAEIDTLRQGVTTIPESYYENPESVKLTPKYQEITQSVNLAASVYQHWKTQLVKMERGEQWQDLDTDKDGKIVAMPAKAATAEDKIQVQENLQQVLNLHNIKQQELQSLQTNFKAKHAESIKVISDINKQYFSAFMDEKSPWKPTIEKIKSMIPEAFRGSPLAESYAYSLAANLAMHERLTQAEKIQAKASTIAATVRGAGPTENSASGSAQGNGAPKIASYDSIMDRMKSA